MREHFEAWQQEIKFRHGGPGRGGFGHGEHESERGRHGRWGRGGERPFDHGELRLVMLVLVRERPRHGYEIIKDIEDRFGGSYSPSPGVVYPTLTMLEELGYTTVAEGAGKKLYTITELGTAYLEENRAAAEAAMGRMAGASNEHGPAPQLLRAFQNLKLAMRLRQRSGPISEDQLHKIVSAIDAAAVTIERA